MEKEKEYIEDEMDLYELLNLLKKYKKMITTTLIIGIVISFVSAILLRNYDRKESATKTFSLNYEQFQKRLDYYEIIGFNYTKFDPTIILNDEKYIDKFLEIPELKKSFEKIKITEKNRVEQKIKFISKIITITMSKEKISENYTVTVIGNKDLNIVEKIMEKYFEILENEIVSNTKVLVKKENEDLKIKNNNASKKLEQLKKEILFMIDEEKKNGDVTSEALEYIIKSKNPLLISNKDFQQNIYDKTLKEIEGTTEILNSNILEGIIEDKTSLIIEDVSSKAKIILLFGITMTIGIIVMYISIKELLYKYKKYEEGKMEE